MFGTDIAHPATGSVEITQICFAAADANSSSTCHDLSSAQRRRRALRSFDPSFAATDDTDDGINSVASQPSSLSASASRALSQIVPASPVPGEASVGFRVLSRSETADSLAAKMSMPSFSTSLTAAIVRIEPAFDGVSVPPTPAPQLDPPPNSRGEQYIVDGAGRALLWTCGKGHMLVNDTFKIQHCADCFAYSYSLDPLDHADPAEVASPTVAYTFRSMCGFTLRESLTVFLPDRCPGVHAEGLFSVPSGSLLRRGVRLSGTNLPYAPAVACPVLI